MTPVEDWAMVVREHGAMVWRTATRLLSDDGEAADCFQDTFVEAAQLAQRSPVWNWPALLKRIATVRALDRLRRRQRDRQRLASAVDPALLSTDDANPGHGLEVAEELARMREVLRSLPPREAEVVCLRYLEELTYEEIAGVLGLTVNAVGVLLHKGRRRLRERWNEARPRGRA